MGSSMEDVAAALTQRRNARASTDVGVSVETPDAPEVEQLTEQELATDEQAGLLAEDDAEPEFELEPEQDGQPVEDEAEADVIRVIDLDGEEIQLDTVREWKQGYMKDVDYRQKTEAIAEQRKHLERQSGDLERLAQTYAFRIGEMDTEVNQQLQQFQNIDWPKLAAEDPQQYTAIKAQHDATMQRKQEIDSRKNEFMQQQQVLRENWQRDQAANAQKELRQRIPEWNDALYYRLIDFGVDQYGFDRDSALNWTDPSTFEALRDAMAYRKGKAVKTKKTVRTAPKKTLKQRAHAPAKPAEQQVAEQTYNTLASSGKLEDAVQALTERRNLQRSKRTG